MSEEKGEFIITTDRMDRSFEETEEANNFLFIKHIKASRETWKSDQ